MPRLPWIVVALSFGALACGQDKVPIAPGGEVGEPCDPETPTACEGSEFVTCPAGGVTQREDCAAQDLVCDRQRGCVSCQPNTLDCDGNTLTLCNADGTAREVREVCAAGTQCSERGCRDLCADALAERSYLGCEYWPTFTSNSQLDDVFAPAVVIANPNLVDATVTIDGGGGASVREVVPPRSSKSVLLAFDSALKGSYDDAGGSVLVSGGAYHLRATVPVTVHQFNPLLFETDRDCILSVQDVPDDGQCNSFTNDASLLLPAHVLARDEGDGVSYLGISRASLGTSAEDGTFAKAFPGFLAITAAGSSAVHVTLKSSAHTLASRDGTLPALAPGDVLEQTLMPGDVLQLRTATPEPCTGTTNVIERTGANLVACDPGETYDLTGSEIQADGPIQVIGGHDCTFVPFDRPACDHLEESLFPVETWGKQVLVSRPRARVGTSYILRVVSAANGNQVTFTPPRAGPLTLGRGEYAEVELSDHVIVTGTKPLAVAQYLEGQGGTRDSGDPSLSLAIPLDQFRGEYYFLSPESYDLNYANVIAADGSEVLLDGERIETWEPLEGTGYRVGAVTLRRPGPHAVASELGDGIGLVLYGFGAYTSYMLPGGLDLRIIADPL